MKYFSVISFLRITTLILMTMTGMQVMAQVETKKEPVDSIDIMMARIDSLTRIDSINNIQEEPIQSILIDSTKIMKPQRDWTTWRPDPKRALWLALVLPGAGQIYNRKYWKLPIIYGGFIGCIYALTWNNMMYKDYSQAYQDIMDDDPNTASYNKFLHLGVSDLSIFVMIGVYALSVIDAYVDAELSAFDISKDLSLKVGPTIIPNHSGGNLLQAQSLGVNCKLNF